MRILISLFFSLMSSYAFALGGGGSAGGSGNSITRNQLLQLDQKYDVAMPMVHLQGQPIDVASVCIDNDIARSIKPVKSTETITRSVSDGKDVVVKVNTTEAILIAPLTQEDTKCLEYRKGFCVKYERTETKLQTVYDMDVREIARGRNNFGRLLYKVKYQIPDCE